MSTIYDSTTNTVAEIAEPVAKTAKPWYRNWITWLVAGVIFVSAIVAAGLIFLQSPHNALSIVKGDGYSSSATIPASEFKAGMDKDTKQYFTGEAAAGIKGTKAEVAVELTASGKTMIPVVLPFLSAAGEGISGHLDGDYLVISGPMKSFDTAGNPFGAGLTG